jgi:hypothetical protein
VHAFHIGCISEGAVFQMVLGDARIDYNRMANKENSAV